MKKKFEVKYSNQAKSDIKRYRRNATKMEVLRHFVELLETGEALPENSRPHLLGHNYKGCMECHMENDFLLIWVDFRNSVIEIVRVGSHAELFRM